MLFATHTLSKAVRTGSVSMVQRALQAKQGLGKEIAAILLEAGADIDASAKEGTALNYALKDGGSLGERKTDELYRWLLDQGASIEASNLEYLVNSAAKFGDLGDNDILDSLLQIEAARKDSKILLKLAVQRDFVKLFQTMLEKSGFSINDYDAEGHTLLHRAADYRSYNVAEFLLTHGADANAKILSGSEIKKNTWRNWEMTWGVRTDGATALHHVANTDTWESKTVGIAELLLEHGADIHATDSQGRTPLHWVDY